MKVTIADFKNALAMFAAKWIASLKGSANKFAAGVALSRFDAGAMLAPFADADGMVDVDALRAAVDAGLAASEGTLVVKPSFDPRLKLLGIGIDEVRLTRADFEDFFTNMVGQSAQ